MRFLVFRLLAPNAGRPELRFPEFKRAISAILGAPVSDEALRQIFASEDVNASNTITLDEFHRSERLLAQREAEQHQQEHDDQASDAMSQDGAAPLPQGIPHEWSTTASSTSTATRRRRKEIVRLRQGRFMRPSDDQIRRNPYI